MGHFSQFELVLAFFWHSFIEFSQDNEVLSPRELLNLVAKKANTWKGAFRLNFRQFLSCLIKDHSFCDCLSIRRLSTWIFLLTATVWHFWIQKRFSSYGNIKVLPQIPKHWNWNVNIKWFYFLLKDIPLNLLKESKCLGGK